MNDDQINVSEDWSLINNKTGEVKPIVLVESGKRERWQKVWAKSLADIMDLTGDEKTKVLAYLIKVKDYENRVIETVRSVADATGVSKTTVNAMFKLLQEHNCLHRIRNGLWRFSPHIMVNGHGAVGAAVFRSWADEENKDV